MATESKAQNMTVRVSPAGVEWVAQVMEQTDASQSVVVRALFAVGTAHPAEVLAKIEQFRDSTAPADTAALVK